MDIACWFQANFDVIYIASAIDDIGWTTANLVVDSRNILAQNCDAQCIHGSEESRDTGNRSPTGDGFTRYESVVERETDAGDANHARDEG